ncbi:MAG: 2OG-Fe(II) oxygenase, partial [Acetobacteraceae bacterium]
YKLDEVVVPAGTVFAKQPESAAWPAIARLREAAFAHLRERIALPLEAPRDWARANPLTCTCADCRALGLFLVDPEQRQWLLKAVQGRRSHVEESVGTRACDLDLRTERRGSPHTLVAVKNQADYERRVRQREQDLGRVSALGG